MSDEKCIVIGCTNIVFSIYKRKDGVESYCRKHDRSNMFRVFKEEARQAERLKILDIIEKKIKECPDIQQMVLSSGYWALTELKEELKKSLEESG